MSDYFGALLRSAGALGTPAGMPTPSAAAAPGVELVEQEVEVEAGAPGERAPTHGELAYEQLAEPTPRPGVAPRVDVLAKRAGMAPQRPTAPAPVPDALPAASSAAPLPRHEDPALAHPMVRAALRWVAADAQAMAAQAQAALPTRAVAPPRAATSLEGEPGFAPTQPVAHPADQGRVAAPPGRPQAVREIGDIELTLPTAPRRHAAADSAAPRSAAPARSIDLHIGTIHVAVDAPPPRAVLQPAPPPAPRPQPPAPERSGLSRMRLPRF